MTQAEKHLWYDFLKSLPYTVHRQKVIDSYVVDFYIAEANLILELDGIGPKRNHKSNWMPSATTARNKKVFKF